MLPWIIGAVVVGVGAIMLDDAKSQNKKARKKHKKTYDNSVKKITHSYENAQRKNSLDKLFKAKRVKQKIADTIYAELKSKRNSYEEINNNIYMLKKRLSELFEQKKIANSHDEKKAIQNSINLIVNTRKDLFLTKDEIKVSISALKAQLKDANLNTKMIQNDINLITY
ncbi:MAG: hypothetical protein L3J43_10415 [Sulfurovum sp.]|nr:hypothetical protein [Sulfurovum sp.]